MHKHTNHDGYIEMGEGGTICMELKACGNSCKCILAAHLLDCLSRKHLINSKLQLFCVLFGEHVKQKAAACHCTGVKTGRFNEPSKLSSLSTWIIIIQHTVTVCVCVCVKIKFHVGKMCCQITAGPVRSRQQTKSCQRNEVKFPASRWLWWVESDYSTPTVCRWPDMCDVVHLLPWPGSSSSHCWHVCN